MSEEGRRENPNEIFGRNLRDLRDRQHISQSELARAMREHGHPWHQSTVYRVEQGRQDVSYWEAGALARILRTSADRFSWAGPEASATEMVYDAGAQLRKRHEAVAHAVFVLLLGHDRAERTLARSESSEYERVQEARRDVAERMDAYSLEAAVEEGIRRYEERGGEAEDGEDQPVEEASADYSDQPEPSASHEQESA
jgi:transcriptional regulator with XRE-family HTH domain